MDFDLDVPPEMKEIFMPLVTKLGSELNLTAEQKSQAMERTLKLQTDPAFMAMIMEIAEKTFGAADENKDGLLNEAEFMKFVQLLKENQGERQDVMPDYTPEQLKLAYECVNKLNKEKDGVSLDEVVMGRFIVNVLTQELQN